MKKVVIMASCLSVIFILNAGGQDIHTILKNTSTGVKGGINFADMLPSTKHQVDIRLAPNLGVFANMPYSDKLSFQPELLISLQGGKQHTFVETTDYEYISDEKHTYLLLPLMAQYRINDKLSIEAGPQLGFRLSAWYLNQIIDQGVVIYETEEDIKDNREFFDIGFNLGLKYDVLENLSAGIRYNIGLKPLNVYREAVILRHSVLQVSVAYTLFHATVSGGSPDLTD